MRLTLVALAGALACLLTFDTASAAPQDISTRLLDLDLKQADIRNVYRLLSDVAGREISLDACVRGTVDLRLKNTPVPLVLDAIAAKLRLSYEDDSGVLRVHCDDDDAGAVEALRVSLTSSGAPLEETLTALAREAKLEGVDYRATARPVVELKLQRVRLSTALAVLADESGLRLTVTNRRLVVTDRK